MSHSNDRPLVLGFMGRQRCGKSHLSALLREVAGSNDPANDIEFSDPITDAANMALATGSRAYPLFRTALNLTTSILVGEPPRHLLDPSYFCTCGSSVPSACPECGLRDWLDGDLPKNFQLTRENKADHRAVLIWLGVIMRKVISEYVWADEVARRVLAVRSGPLVTVGGVRDPKDAEVIRSIGGHIVRIIGKDESPDPDPANARSDEIEPDALVYNQVWVPEVTLATVTELWRDLKSGQLWRNYGPSI